MDNQLKAKFDAPLMISREDQVFGLDKQAKDKISYIQLVKIDGKFKRSGEQYDISASELASDIRQGKTKVMMPSKTRLQEINEKNIELGVFPPGARNEIIESRSKGIMPAGAENQVKEILSRDQGSTTGHVDAASAEKLSKVFSTKRAEFDNSFKAPAMIKKEEHTFGLDKHEGARLSYFKLEKHGEKWKRTEQKLETSPSELARQIKAGEVKVLMANKDYVKEKEQSKSDRILEVGTKVSIEGKEHTMTNIRLDGPENRDSKYYFEDQQGNDTAFRKPDFDRLVKENKIVTLDKVEAQSTDRKNSIYEGNLVINQGNKEQYQNINLVTGSLQLEKGVSFTAEELKEAASIDLQKGAALNAPDLEQVRTIILAQDSKLNAPELKRVEGIDMQKGAELHSPALHQVDQSLRLQEGASANLPELQMAASIKLQQNASLKSANLVEVVHDLRLQNDSKLHAPYMESVGVLQIEKGASLNARISKIGFLKLGEQATFKADGLEKVDSLELNHKSTLNAPKLKQLEEGFLLDNSTLNAPELRKVDHLDIQKGAALNATELQKGKVYAWEQSKVNAPQLSKSGGSLIEVKPIQVEPLTAREKKELKEALQENKLQDNKHANHLFKKFDKQLNSIPDKINGQKFTNEDKIKLLVGDLNDHKNTKYTIGKDKTIAYKNENEIGLATNLNSKFSQGQLEKQQQQLKASSEKGLRV